MFINKLRKNSKLYVRLLLGMTVFIAAAIIAASSIYYISYSRIMLADAYQSDLESLRNTSQFVQSATDSAQSLSFQIYRNSTLAKLLYYYEPNEFDIQGALLELNNYLNSIPFIESIYVYNLNQEKFYVVSRNGEAGILSLEELYDRDIIEVLDNYEDYRPFIPIPRRYKIAKTDTEPTGIYTYLCYDAINVDRQITSAVIVNISAHWINKSIETGSNNLHRQTYIMDDHKRILSADGLKLTNGGSDEERLVSLLEQGTAYQIDNIDGTKSLISYTSPDRFSWRYIRITPYGNITETIAEVRSKTVQMAAGILISGVLLAWIVSAFLYRPFRKIVNQVHVLESKQRESSYTIRQNALRKLLQIQSFDPIVQQNRLRQTGIAFDIGKPYRLLYIRIDRFSQLKEHNDSDLLTYKFAIMNIGSEISSRFYQVETVDIDEDSILMLMNTLQTGEADEPDWLGPMASEIQQVCMEYFSISLTIVTSPISTDPFQLQTLFKRVKEASRHRLFMGTGAVIHTTRLVLRPSSAYHYPTSKEKRMVEALKTGRTDEAKDWFTGIVKETAEYPISVVESTLSYIAMTISNILNEIQKNGAIHPGSRLALQVPDFKSYETIEEISEAYFQIFEELKARISEKRNGKQENLIRQINQIIESRYDDPNLSLQMIADELKLSTFYISRVYRQHTLNTIVDVINSVRMQHAKALLLEGNRPVAEIADLTGYTNSSYFYRMFKKFNGVTPAEYRKANQG